MEKSKLFNILFKIGFSLLENKTRFIYNQLIIDVIPKQWSNPNLLKHPKDVYYVDFCFVSEKYIYASHKLNTLQEIEIIIEIEKFYPIDVQIKRDIIIDIFL